MSSTLAAIIGGAAGAIALVVIAIAIFWHFTFQARNSSRRSGTGSSDPSIQIGSGLGTEFASSDARRYGMEELSSATRNFDNRSLIGIGKFGEVYKGLLNDGTLVAIKRRHGSPSQEFADEVCYLSFIRHRNLVTLLGYCQENELQILVYEFIPNGSVSSHLYGSGQAAAKLDFKHRLAIALGAARGLNHLHSLSPKLIHKDFKTANVLVDEDFIAKVADSGLLDFVGRFDHGGPSSQETAPSDIFLAPEVRELRQFSDRSDVYSFGVFLLELVCGQDAKEVVPFQLAPGLDLAEWVGEELEDRSRTVDKRLGNGYTKQGMGELMQLMMLCLQKSSERRPSMNQVVLELDRILEREMSLTIIMGEGTPVVTLGSQLFRASK